MKSVTEFKLYVYICITMPILRRIVVQDFRNIRLAELEFSPNINCISGGNGEGKTNLLDSIHYLSMTKSAFSASDKYNFRHGTDSFSIAGNYIMDNGLESKFTVRVKSDGEKKIRRDDKQYDRVSEHIGALPVVMINPSDSSMINESGEERRRFTNAVLSQISSNYLSDIQQYNRLLSQRNKLLKEGLGNMELIAVYDMKMSDAADRIYRARKRFAEDLNPIVKNYYTELSGAQEDVSIKYCSDLDSGSLADLLAKSREKDYTYKYTTVGIQRDDLIFSMDGHPIRRCGSQGQQKSFIVSLKFAQYDIMKNNYGFAPILLLDDVFDKLDIDRIANLLSMVAGQEFGQIFITDSNKVRMSGIVDRITENRAYFEAEGGNFKTAEV